MMFEIMSLTINGIRKKRKVLDKELRLGKENENSRSIAKRLAKFLFDFWSNKKKAQKIKTTVKIANNS